MNRKARRAILRQNGKTTALEATPDGSLPGVEELHETALIHRKKGDLLRAQTLCRAILTREPKHLGALIIMGGTSQEQGRNSAAIRFLNEALALDDRSARAHDNLALTYQALGRHHEAVAHFIEAIANGLGNIEAIVKHSAAVSALLNKLAAAWPKLFSLGDLFGPTGLRAISHEGLLLALLQTRVVCDLELERFLTTVRRALLHAVTTADSCAIAVDELRFFSALAQQCFINEYIYPLDDAERGQATRLRDRLTGQLDAGAEIVALDAIVMAMYMPLHTLPGAPALLRRPWAHPVAEIIEPLLAQQVREPMEEAADRDAIPILTAAEDLGSLENEKQYDENPYPRWFNRPRAQPTTLDDYLRDKLGHVPRRTLQQ